MVLAFISNGMMSMELKNRKILREISFSCNGLISRIPSNPFGEKALPVMVSMIYKEISRV